MKKNCIENNWWALPNGSALFAGMPRQAMRAQCCCNRYPLTLLGNVPAEVKFQFFSPFYSTPPSMSFRGRAAPVGISRYNLNSISAPKSVGNLQIVQWTDTFLAYLAALREIATSAPSGPPRNDITGKVCSINSNLTSAGTNREGPMVCR